MFGCNHYQRSDNGPGGDGWPLAINTTLIDGNCPVPKPGSPSTYEEYVANTYAIADGIIEDCISGTALAAQKIKLAKCRKYGFKNVQARKVWHGRVGFGQDKSTTGTRYLKATIERTGYVTGDDDARYQAGTSSYNQKRVVAVGRYSGQGARLVDINDLDDPGWQGNLDYLPIAPEILVTYDEFGEPTFSWATGDTAMDSYLNGTAPVPAELSISKSWSATSLEISVTETTAFYSPSDSPFRTRHKKIKITLEEPYTVDDVNEDLDGLLDYWNLDDDVVYPFRTDTFTHHAPLVSYEEGFAEPTWDTNFVPGWASGRLLGKPLYLECGVNRGGNQPFWNSNHANTQVNEITGNVDVVSRGAYAPDWCPNATHWTEDTSNVRFVQGAFYSFECSLWPNDSAWRDWSIGFNTAIKTKWCETFMWTYPAHNYARPCGPDDRAKMDDGEPRWPDAPCFCNDPTQTTDCETPLHPDAVNPLNTTTPKGDFCVKRFSYDFKANAVEPPPVLGALTSVQCSQLTATRARCQPTVIYVQKNAPERPGAIHIAEPSRPHFNETHGGLSIVQIKQRMADPLWREGDSENPTIEECRDCADMGGCDGYVESVNAGGARDNRCEWSEDKAWVIDLGAP